MSRASQLGKRMAYEVCFNCENADVVFRNDECITLKTDEHGRSTVYCKTLKRYVLTDSYCESFVISSRLTVVKGIIEDEEKEKIEKTE